MEETYLYTCHYCKKEYVPKRRRVNKFCSDSCRSSNWQLLNPKEVVPSIEREEFSTPVETNPEKNEKLEEKINKKEKPIKIEEMSAAGIKTVIAGNAIYDASKALINLLTTKEENKPPTKGDFAEVIKHLGRFHPIENLPSNEFGQKPFFDMYTKSMVYRGFINPAKSFL